MIENNAIIVSARITTEDHGLLSAWLMLDFGSSGQRFGGYNLFTPNNDIYPQNFAGLFIWRCLEIADVERWEDLVGKTIRVRRDDGRIHAIGHIVKDNWFDPVAEFQSMKLKGAA